MCLDRAHTSEITSVESTQTGSGSCYTEMDPLMAEHDETQGFMPGPLDDLVPGLRRKSERWPALPVHPRILEAARDDGSHALAMASFAPAVSLKLFHTALKPLVEAALLSELSRPVEELRERTSKLRALELY